MRTVVTGGAGFIGSHLAEKLIKLGHSVVILDNLSTGSIANINDFIDNVEFHQESLEKIGEWQKLISDADVVYHLASLADIVPSIENPEAIINLLC